jgi:uncharacterized protein YqgV (UPF0045/DUF77 family)
MFVSVEISLYPLADEFVPTIKAFLDRLGRRSELTVLTNTMSTRVFGDYDRVFEALGEEMRRVHEHVPHAVFVTKIIGGDLRPKDGGYP